MLDRFISGVVRAADPSDRQAIEVRDRSHLIARETLTNSMDFAQQVMHVRQPQELFQLQSEFVSKTSADVCGTQQALRAKASGKGCIRLDSWLAMA
jgi:hypothetical protein